MNKILIIGPAPVRIGGVSVHIYRLHNLLKDEYSFDFIDEGRGRIEGFFNLRSLNLIKYFHKLRRADVIHIHSGLFILRFVHIIITKFLLHKYVVVSIHCDLIDSEHFVGVTKFLLKKCDCVVLDSKEIFDSLYVENSKCKYFMMPAFLPPSIDEEDELSDEVKKWIKEVKSKASSVLMSSSAYEIMMLNDVDLYGIDMCIDSVKILNDRDKQHCYFLLLIILNGKRQPEMLNRYVTRIKEQSPDKILLLTEPSSFIRIMNESDVVLRPTNTDGDSLTIREALFYNKTVVASDCTGRPKGAVVFKTRDIDDMCEKIISSLSQKNDIECSLIDYKSFYTNCYNNGHI